MNHLLSLLFCFLLSIPVFSQCSDLEGIEFTYCYGDLENTVLGTFCPDDPPYHSVKLTISDGYIDNNDFLYIYDDDNLGPFTMGSISGESTSNIFIATNPTGCLTLHLTSDFVFSCSEPIPGQEWPEITYSFECVCVTQTLNPFSLSTQNLCVGEVFSLDASSSQVNEALGAAYHWDFGDGTSAVETSPQIEHFYNEPGIYFISLEIVDEYCTSSLITRMVNVLGQVETNLILPDTICSSEVYNLSSQIINTYSSPIVAGEFSSGQINEIIIGQGPNVVNTSILVDVEEGVFIEDVSNFQVSLDISHTWFGDIGIYLICPNGTEIALHSLISWAGYNYDLTGCCYDFTSNAEETLKATSDSLGDAQNVPIGAFLPSESFELLIGCPIAGDWALRIDESHPSDDGVLHSWSITFGDSLSLDIGSLIDESAVWNGPGLAEDGLLTAPDSAGIYSYSLSYLDPLSCGYFEEFDLEVIACQELDADSIFLESVSEICLGEYFVHSTGIEFQVFGDTIIENIGLGLNSDGYKEFETVTILALDKPVVLAVPASLCAAMPELNLGSYAGVSPPGGRWFFGMDTIGQELLNDNLIQTNLTNESLFYYQVSNASGCISGDVLLIEMVDAEIIYSEAEVCIGESFQLGNGIEFQVFGDTIIENIFIGLNEMGCEILENLLITGIEKPLLEIEPAQICPSNNDINLANYTGVNPNDGTWYLGSDDSGNPLTGDDLFQTDLDENAQFYYEITNEAACKTGEILNIEYSDTCTQTTIAYLADDFDGDQEHCFEISQFGNAQFKIDFKDCLSHDYKTILFDNSGRMIELPTVDFSGKIYHTDHLPFGLYHLLVFNMNKRAYVKLLLGS